MPELLVLKNGCKMKWDLAFILSLLPRRKCICLCCFPGFWSRICNRAKRAKNFFQLLFSFFYSKSVFILQRQKNKMSYSKAKLKVCLGFLWGFVYLSEQDPVQDKAWMSNWQLFFSSQFKASLSRSSARPSSWFKITT